MKVHLFCLALSVLLSGIASAQTKSSIGKAANAPAADQLKIIADQQQQILASLADIKRLLATSGARGPVQSAPPPPVNIQADLSRGNDSASLPIIEYGDFQCPYCGQFEREVYPQVLADYIDTGKARFIFRDAPLEMHPRAVPAARAAHCAGDQNKYWEMHDSLYANQATLADRGFADRAQALGLDAAQFADCMSGEKHTDEIQASAAEAQNLGVTGTPTFFIGTIGPNGDVVNIQRKIVGTASYDVFKSAIDSVLASQQKQSAAPN